MPAPTSPIVLDRSDRAVTDLGRRTLDEHQLMKRLAETARRNPNVLGDPSGGDLGETTLNAEGLYENGSEVLTVVGGKTLTGGFVHTEYDHGTKSSGSITPNPSNGLKQKVTNNGAFTITATAEIGDVELRVINAASAGTISFSGFEKQWPGDVMNTTNGNQFVVFIYGFDGKQAYLIKALQ